MNSSVKLSQRNVGSQGLVASAQGFGAMGMTAFYKGEPKTEDELMDVFAKCLEVGINFIDTAWIYQNFTTGATNEELVGKAIKKFGREKFVIATKFGIVVENGKLTPNGKPELVRKQCEESLKRLDINCIDLYYMHRMDRTVQIEETMEELNKLKSEGKIKYVGLSECTAEELERAHKVCPISAIQMEYSLQTRGIENKILPTARKLGIAVVAYSPLGRGLLSRTFTKKEDIISGDRREHFPRFTGDNLTHNLSVAEKLENFAKTKGYTSGQVALGWLHHQGEDIFPIPGTRSASRVDENAASIQVTLTDDEWKAIEDICIDVKGNRYDEENMKKTFEIGSDDI